MKGSNKSNTDKSMLKKYIDKVDNNIIVNYGRLIYTIEVFTLKDLCRELKTDNRHLTKLMLQENIIYKDGKKYSLTDEYNNNKDIILKNSSPLRNIKLTLEGYKCIYDKLKGKEIFKIKPKEIEYDYIEQEENYVSFKDFLSAYKLNVKYNEVFSFFREIKIFEYIVKDDDKKENRPTKEYKKWFSVIETKTDKGFIYGKIYINKTGSKEIYKILYDNAYISNL